MRNEDIREILISEEEIKLKVEEIGKRITKDYSDKDNIVVIGILKGSLPFMADLIRAIKLPVEIDFMSVSSYGNGTETSGSIKIRKDIDRDIRDKNVIIAEDIIDSGVTLSNLIKLLYERAPKSVEICTLANKAERRIADIDVKYIGFDIPDEFVVGYGLDYAEKYRNLPYIGVLKREVYE